MGKLICLINDIDYSDEFISLQGLESTGPDVVGTATLLLRKTSGGLDLNPGMTVEVYEAFNDAGVGVKERGRYFGGFINMREGVGEMSSTFYTLNCVDNNILLDAITESVNNTLTVEAATFSDQILDIITTKQGAGGYLTRSIDAVSQVANITGASILPEIEFSHGETLREMIQKVCDNAILDNPAVEPRFFMHVDTTFGIGDAVGYAVLYIYDGALTPASSFHFKASALTNSGSDRPIYGQFRYKLDAAPTLITKLQSHWAGSSTATVEDAAAIAAYPNPYLSSGAWLAKPIEDTVSTTQAEAEAQLEAIISQTANPRRSIAFTSRQMVRPGEMVDITWPMEGITAQAYRVAGVSVLIPDNGDVACNITLDRMEMELGAPYVIGSSITTTGGGGHGTFTGLANPFNIESGTWTLINDASDTVGTFNGASLNSPTFLSTDTGSNVAGLSAQGVHSTGIAGGTVRGLEAGGYYYGTADVDTIMGINASANVFAPSTGDVDHIRAIEANIEHDGSGTVTDAAGLYVATPTTSDGPVTEAYGIYVEDQATGQTGEAWAAYLNGNTRITGYILARNQGAFTTAANARAEESTGDPGWIVRGLNTEGTYMGNGTQGAVYGLTAYATTGWGTTGDVDNMTVMQAAIDHVGDGTITTAIGLHVLYPQTVAGDITTAYGIYVDNQDSGSVGTAWAAWFDGNVHITGDLTVDGTGGGGGGGLTVEDVQDAIAAMLIAGANTTLTYDDVGNTLEIASTGGGGTGGSEWSVLTNGDVASPELIFAMGDVVMIETP